MKSESIIRRLRQSPRARFPTPIPHLRPTSPLPPCPLGLVPPPSPLPRSTFRGLLPLIQTALWRAIRSLEEELRSPRRSPHPIPTPASCRRQLIPTPFPPMTPLVTPPPSRRVRARQPRLCSTSPLPPCPLGLLPPPSPLPRSTFR